MSGDFSIDGLLIRTDNLFPMGSVVSITLYLPDGATSQLKGRVRRVLREASDSFTGAGRTSRGGMGIEIIERDSNYLKFFMSLLSAAKL
jgi:PilZ domain